VDRRQASQVTWGLVLIALGLIFLGERQGISPRIDFARLWPVLLLVFGLTRFLTRQDDGHGSGVWMIFLGVLFLLDNYRVLTLNQSWPLFIVAGGLSILFGRRHRDGRTPGRS
jgi:O-antigen ligase